MSVLESKNSLNLPKIGLSEFFHDLEGRLALLTGLVNPDQFDLTLEDIRRPVLIIGLPGIGKTCGIISTIKKMNSKLPENKQLGFKKILLGQTVVGSLTGIPVALPSGKVVRVQMPDLPDPERDGEYGVLFLDEITTADEMQIQPALGLADDSRSLGEYSLPEHWIVVAAGNGPDCTNFVRLDDMTLSRFMAYDIAYEFKFDWREYAHNNNIDPDIIAYLNFSPESMVKVESTDMDNSGKMFPCPRTWERLSTELRIRRAYGTPVDQDEMDHFAGRIIGHEEGRKFAAFMNFKQTMKYDADKILEGTEKELDAGEAEETFHIILQALVKKLSNLMKTSVMSDGKYPLEMYQKWANAIRWLLATPVIDRKINAIVEMRDNVDGFRRIMLSSDFDELCPELEQFCSDYAEAITTESARLSNLR